MNFWWVNQNQTYKYEVTGGYLWSPKKNKNGVRNPFYDFMTKVAPGDIVFSFCDTYIKAIGVVQANCEAKKKPREFGVAGDYWSEDGWYVPITFQEIAEAHQIRPKEYIEELRPLLDFEYAPLIKESGNGKQAVYLTKITFELAQVLSSLANIELEAIRESLFNPEAKAEKEEALIIEDPALSETTKKALINARRGQGKFKSNVAEINHKCFFTGLSDINFLRASHIKPWAESSNKERLDGNNGLLLVPHIDHLFDKGYITFMDSGALIISPQLPDEVINTYQLFEYKTDRRLNEKQKIYMSYHRENIFKK